ncbi:MAG: bacillithiol system redox-active protein YtxJ [Chitinophagaceae bacterium]|nr:MAG: bacillithiol system redox-active protein YtxJ [Chitinophagaceae bacterium]
MEWKVLRDDNELNEIVKKSETLPQVIFKHSTRCSISSVAKNRLEKASAPSGADFYYLDIISYRSISNNIAERFMVHHESPQILVIRNGNCIYDESHMGIRMSDIEAAL